MNGGKVSPPPVIPAGLQRMPARFADATRARQAALAFDLQRLPAEYYVNPYPTYHALREHSPVHRLPDGGYFVSRYADCVALYKDTLRLLLRQAARVRAQIWPEPALRAPHDEPCLQ